MLGHFCKYRLGYTLKMPLDSPVPAVQPAKAVTALATRCQLLGVRPEMWFLQARPRFAEATLQIRQ
jgi:hypothetical protein